MLHSLIIWPPLPPLVSPSCIRIRVAAGAPAAASASTGGGFQFGVGAAAPAAGAGSSSSSSMDVDGGAAGRREPREPVRFQPGVTSGSVLVSGSGDCGQLGLGMKHSDLNAPHHLSLLDRKSIVKIAYVHPHHPPTDRPITIYFDALLSLLDVI